MLVEAVVLCGFGPIEPPAEVVVELSGSGLLVGLMTDVGSELNGRLVKSVIPEENGRLLEIVVLCGIGPIEPPGVVVVVVVVVVELSGSALSVGLIADVDSEINGGLIETVI